MADAEPALCRVEVAYSPAPRELQLIALSVPAGTTVLEVLQASGLGLEWGAQAVGLWGRSVPTGQAVRDGDRIEVYRGLRVDPKEARRQRQQALPRKATGSRR